MEPSRGGFYRFTGAGTLMPILSGIMPLVPQSMASPMPASWNQVASWLKRIEALREAARAISLARQLPHAIADSAHRLNDSGAVAELLAERTDADVHNVAAAGVAVSPDVFKE